MSDRVGVAKWFMRGLLLFVLAFANLNDIWSPDVLPNALFAWTVVRRFARERWALVLVLLYFFGTSVRTVASQALWQHAGVHLAIALALWLVFLARPVALWRELVAGAALGFGAVVRQTTAMLVPSVPAGRVRATIFAIVGAAIGLLPLPAYKPVGFGNPLEQGFGTKP